MRRLFSGTAAGHVIKNVITDDVFINTSTIPSAAPTILAFITQSTKCSLLHDTPGCAAAPRPSLKSHTCVHIQSAKLSDGIFDGRGWGRGSTGPETTDLSFSERKARNAKRDVP